MPLIVALVCLCTLTLLIVLLEKNFKNKGLELLRLLSLEKLSLEKKEKADHKKTFLEGNKADLVPSKDLKESKEGQHLIPFSFENHETFKISGQVKILNIEYNETTGIFSFSAKGEKLSKVTGIALGKMLPPQHTREILTEALWTGKYVKIQMTVKKINGRIKEASLERLEKY
ncbi:hypothetical protein FAI40_10185 [Acetobacteraceae bacterium]|nr:hypothetical protein FAI40_10185 [Acetobacteraceae bacterium]